MNANTTQDSVKVTHEPTPNPATMKFVFNRMISPGSFDFPNVESTDASPLAAKIFGFPWTAGVFIGPDFVTVTKQDWVDWNVLATPLAGLLGEHIEQNLPVIVQLEKTFDESANDSDIVKQIKRVLQNEIKPVVAMDGGDIAFAKYEENILQLKMMGSCSGCPSSQATLKEGIEVRMKQVFPEIKEVVAI